MNKEISTTELDIFNYQSVQSGTKAQVKVGEFIFESHSVQHFSLNYKLITWGEHHTNVSILEVSTMCCPHIGIPMRTGLAEVISFT